MPRFFFKAKDWSGKIVKGSLDLPTEADVLESVRSSGFVPLAVAEEKKGKLVELKKALSRVGSKEVTSFTRQLSTMMTAGLALTDALSLLKTQAAGGAMYEVLEYALNMVRGGQSLGRALERYRKYFGEAYIASINAGEEGGVLEEILGRLAENMEKEEEFNGKVKGAMIYPIIVVVGMIGVVIIMMVFVIPKLMAVYADYGSKMPAITRALMAMSTFMAKFWFLFPVIFGGMAVGGRMVAKIEGLRIKRDKVMLKLPIVGDLIEKTVLANITRTLSMLLRAGIPLVEALKIVSGISGNLTYDMAITRISERVQKGFSIASSFEETGVFPIILVQMIETGEATGKLDEVLMKVSNYFSTQAEQAVKALTAAIEPLIMIVLGIGVGFLVVAVIMPIYNLTSQF